MKQVLLRVPDDVRQRLAERAAEHRSVNALATELLDRAVDELEQEPAGVPTGQARAAAIAASRGTGAQLDRLLTDGR